MGAQFETVATQWKWSRVHFGRVDVHRDRAMATKWLELRSHPPAEVGPLRNKVLGPHTNR
eukprot:795610-Amphidinium_carterae.1